MSRGVVSLLLVAALCASCQKFAEGRLMFRELLALRDRIAKKFDEKVVDVSLANGNHMIVQFIDSPLMAQGREEKQKRADAVAAFVADHFSGELSSVSVQFVTRSGGGPLRVVETYVGKPAPKP